MQAATPGAAYRRIYILNVFAVTLTQYDERKII